MANHPLNPSGPSVRDHLHEIVFEADTPAGKAFDVLLILSILGSVIVVMLDSVETIHARSGVWLTRLEWTFTILFTVEYVVRLASVRRPWGYALSFFGVIDLLAIIPTYLSLVVAGTQSLLVIRILRLLRVFRVFKLGYYLSEAVVRTTVNVVVHRSQRPPRSRSSWNSSNSCCGNPMTGMTRNRKRWTCRPLAMCRLLDLGCRWAVPTRVE